MNKSAIAFMGALAVLCLVALGYNYPPSAYALDKPLGELKTATTTCTTTAAELAAGTVNKRSMTIVNTSSTCVFVGGSNVDGSTAGTTGIAVGDGCTAGTSFPMDLRRAWCITAAGSQAVEILYGN